ncbi:MAG: prolipoprotein diacylglyceryl transferase family protein, partial [Bulleidia sp.]|nr:prolipoprotein diacylglyceryl transferase family protein [Bulleidia sp.]
MFNDWLTIGGLTIHGYGVMIAVGILTAVWLAEKQTAKYGLDSTKVDGLAITAVVVGYIFSKLTYI